eukprot:jgi/Psemu1/25245/gm1.25245_g
MAGQEARLPASRLLWALASHSTRCGERWKGKALLSALVPARKKPTALQQPQNTTQQIAAARSFYSRSLRCSCSDHHIACGFLAGLHSHQQPNLDSRDEVVPEEEEPPEFDSFESAWEAVRMVPEELLDEFEDELWKTQSKRFVYGTKTVSVIDAIERPSADSLRNQHQQPTANGVKRQTTDIETTDGANSDGQRGSDERIFRYLVLNERPHLIQTAIEVDSVGAPYDYRHSDGQPSPISQTHLGGLAMALPFWRKANAGVAEATPGDNNARVIVDDLILNKNAPNCVLIGAGGCSLAHTLAADLYRHYSHEQRPLLSAVEACPEILRASRLWFGAGTETQDGHGPATAPSSSQTPLPPASFDLVCDTGESYLQSLKSCCDEENEDGPNQKMMIDVLIIDAEDGSAPPESMRTTIFWTETVLPVLNFGERRSHRPVVGVNAIGNESEVSELMDTMRKAFDDDSEYDEYTILAVSPPPEAKVSNRHKLVFVLPISKDRTTTCNPRLLRCQNLLLTEDELRNCVDVPASWEQQVRIALAGAP